MQDEFIWSQKYRPKTVDECILPDSIKKNFKNAVAQGQTAHLLLHGSPGVGKTTIAIALCEEIGADYILLNGSDENGIDTIRNKVINFASTVSLTGAPKVVILDEGDYLTPAAQPALRNVMETFSGNCRFIITANYANRLIPALHSRTTAVKFIIPNKEKPVIAGEFFNRLCFILDTEKIQYNKKVVAAMVTKYFPDFRKTINELQQYASGGSIDEGILSTLTDVKLKELFGALKAGNFKTVRSWVVQNLDSDPNALLRSVYDYVLANDVIESSDIPKLILLISEYQYKAVFVADMEVNLVAFFVEIMVDITIK